MRANYTSYEAPHYAVFPSLPSFTSLKSNSSPQRPGHTELMTKKKVEALLFKSF
jgi:hypothetical protein